MLTKTEFCENCIKEADRMIDAMNAMKHYCCQVIEEEERKELGGYRGDGANDPENIRRQPRVDANLTMNKLFKPAFDKMVEENEIVFPAINLPALMMNVISDIDKEEKASKSAKTCNGCDKCSKKEDCENMVTMFSSFLNFIMNN